MKLNTKYMGLALKNPIVASASPLSRNLDNIKSLEDAGAAAVVMFSLFEEQLIHENAAMEHLLNSGTESFPESLSYFPNAEDYEVGPDSYLNLIRQAREATDIPIIASLNGASNKGWIDFSKKMQQAGASAIELNTYSIPVDLNVTGTAIEKNYIDVIKEVKSSVSIPVAVKLSPFFSSMGHMGKQIDAAGADALVLFNRFYQPDVDLDNLEIHPSLELSQASEIRLPLLWIAVLYGNVKASLAASRGVESADEVIKYIMAGADVVMTTSALLKKGISQLSVILKDMQKWMESKDYESVEQMRGCMSRNKVANPGAFERANYIKVLESYENPYTL
jgi:dihydroorotate dehydrogenase (fumarate)